MRKVAPKNTVTRFDLPYVSDICTELYDYFSFATFVATEIITGAKLVFRFMVRKKISPPCHSSGDFRTSAHILA